MDSDSPSATTVRDVAAGDMAAITEIYAEAVLHGTATFELVPPDQAEMERRMRKLVEGGFPYLVAEREGRVVGYAYAGPYRERRAYRWTLEDSVYIVPTAQRLGVGSALLGRLVEESARRGFRQMVAVIGDADNAGSVAVHARHDFKHVGTFEAVGRKHGRWLATVLMQRSLGMGELAPPPEED